MQLIFRICKIWVSVLHIPPKIVANSKSSIECFASTQDGVKRTRFTHSSETTTKNQTKHMKQPLTKHWISSNKGHRPMRDGKQMRYIPKSIALREFPGWKNKEREHRILQIPWIEKMELRVRKTETATIHRTKYWREEGYIENADVCRGPHWSIQKTDSCMQMRKLSMVRVKNLKELENRVSGTHKKSGILTKTNWKKLVIHWPLGRLCRKEWPQ